MSTEPSYLQQEIMKAIKRSGLSQYRLAKLSGVSQGVISRFINGERDLTLATASKLVKALGLEVKAKKKGR